MRVSLRTHSPRCWSHSFIACLLDIFSVLLIVACSKLFRDLSGEILASKSKQKNSYTFFDKSLISFSSKARSLGLAAIRAWLVVNSERIGKTNAIFFSPRPSFIPEPRANSKIMLVDRKIGHHDRSMLTVKGRRRGSDVALVQALLVSC